MTVAWDNRFGGGAQEHIVNAMIAFGQPCPALLARTRNDVLGNCAVLVAAAGVFGTSAGRSDVIVTAIMAALGIQARAIGCTTRLLSFLAASMTSISFRPVC
jgi:hypothetical protein